ncbi:uncharacterized protein LOC114516059 [Dendronephthya gigantea]|uniref:uncharacterized protein LOC114516059 n=1 Tax=Dendronephthya gigantea TaxID=151771 RepID=UPI001068EEDC|nr:uncharacterized protein LOC114516059 [Dendronephthya gigantea]XP_028391221.1 uncharacterized protein LOC114516059 [Dendronephthya gigantea]
MGATASINYAAAKKYKPSEPIEVKFDKVVKYDDGDEKPFPDDLQLVPKKQPLSLLATAIRILEKKPKEQTIAHNDYLHSNYARQARPRSAYVVLKKPTQSSSTLNSSHQRSTLSNGIIPKQQKTKQNLYMSLLHQTPARDPKYGMTVPSRLRTPMDYHLPARQTKANTLPRSSAGDAKNDKRRRVNHKLYLDMIRPAMMSPQYQKLSATRGPPMQRTTSRQSQLQHTQLTPRPPSGAQVLRRIDPNSRAHQQRGAPVFREQYRPHREDYTTPVSRPPTAQRHLRDGHGSSSMNSSVRSLPQKELHFPHLTRKTKDDVSLNSSLNSRSQIPRTHPDNITPLYFRKSLAFSPNYGRRELLSSPLSSRRT